MEDYQLGRKGPQAAGTTAVGSSLFNGGSTFGTSTGGLQAGFGTGRQDNYRFISVLL